MRVRDADAADAGEASAAIGVAGAAAAEHLDACCAAAGPFGGEVTALPGAAAGLRDEIAGPDRATRRACVACPAIGPAAIEADGRIVGAVTGTAVEHGRAVPRVRRWSVRTATGDQTGDCDRYARQAHEGR